MKITPKKLTTFTLISLLAIGGLVWAGLWNPTTDTSTSNFITLGDLYQLTQTLDASSTPSHSVSTTTSATSTMHTIEDVYNSIISIMVPDESNVKSGVTYGNVPGGHYLTGTMTDCVAGSNATGTIYTSASNPNKLNPSGAPGQTMITLEDIYQKLYNFDYLATSTPPHNISTSSSPASSMHTLQDLWNLMTTINLPSTTEVRQGILFGQASNPMVGTDLEGCPVATGSQWTEVTNNAGWEQRDSFSALAFNNKMWVMGGYGSVGSLNDVWFSSDGINWTEATANAGWGQRASFSALVFNNKIWVLGGNGSGGDLSDVWSSSDGINWTEATANAGWGQRDSFSATVFDNKIWVLGGNNNGSKNDVWYSSDGINWTEATANAGWEPRNQHVSFTFDNKIWVSGGLNTSSTALNDVWSSSDGINWTEATSSADWEARAAFPAFVSDNEIWVLGGYVPYSSSHESNDVWSSSDGINWTEATTSANWSTRQIHAAFRFNNKMWVLGGYSSAAGGDLNDVWSAPVSIDDATAPTSITLAVGNTNPVGGVTDVSVPAAGDTDITGQVTGWVSGSADTIRFTVTDGGSALSTITINSSPYISGSDYTISSTSSLTIVVTTSEGGMATGVRTFVVSVVSAVTVPEVPTSVSATAGDSQATVTFTAPASDGGSAITGYTVTSSPGGITAAGVASPITVTGLTNGTSYIFTVVATNAVGDSPSSTASSPVTPVAPGFSCGDSVVGSGSDTLTYGTVLAADGRCWLDRNLGATEVATAANDYLAYGNLYQWGRSNDGHQLINWSSPTTGSPYYGTTGTLATTDNPGNNLFILSTDSATLN